MMILQNMKRPMLTSQLAGQAHPPPVDQPPSLAPQRVQQRLRQDKGVSIFLIARAGTLMYSRSIEGTEDRGGGEDR